MIVAQTSQAGTMSFARSQHSKRSPSSNESSGPQENIDDTPGQCSNRCNNCCNLLQCKICLETAKDVVVSMCGHLFCWPCLYQWMYATDSNNQSHKSCPVCKSAISRERTIPLYGDDSDRQDPRDKLPPRPPGQRTEVPNQPNQFPYGNVWAMGGPSPHIFGFGDAGFHMSFGFASLPQYVFAFMNEFMASDRRNDTDFFLMKFFAICGFLCILLTVYLC